MSSHNWKDRLLHILEDKQAQDIQSFPVKFAFAGHFIVVSALSSRHLWTLCQSVEKECKQNAIPFKCQGKDDETCWIIIDAQDVLVHIFLKEGREYYNLEGLWKPEKNEYFATD